MIGVAERQIANLNVHLPEGTTLTTVDPVVDVVGPVRDRAGAPAHQQGLRLAARRRPPGRRATPTSGPTSPTAPTPSSRPAARPGAWRSRSGPPGRIGEDDAGTLALVREHKEHDPRPGRPAQAARLPGARRLRGLVDRLRGPHGRAARRACPPSPPVADRDRHGLDVRRSGRPSSPGGGRARRGRPPWRRRARRRARRRSTSGRSRRAPGSRSSARRTRSGSSAAGRWWR